MTTSEPRPTTGRTALATGRTLSSRRFFLACALGLTAVGILWLVFTLAGQPDTAAGALVGGVLVLVLATVARWRASRRAPSEVGSASRTLVGIADERDKAILTAALAWVGLAAFLANAVGLAALAVGADASSVIGVIEAFLIAVLVAAFVVLARRL